MCDRCDGANATPPEVPARRADSEPDLKNPRHFSRRMMLAMGGATLAGFAFSLLDCQPEAAPPATTASNSKPANTARITNAAPVAPGTREAPEASATETARGTPAASAPASRGAAPPLGSQLFPDAQGYPLATAIDAPVSIVPRADWTTAGPDLAHIDLMNGISRLTVHHTAGEIQTDAWLPTARELENIREFHAGTRPSDRKWADIAYHFAVDRAGRVWQARPLAYQGAHARGNNEHNLGIVLLGNFEVQSPAAAQLRALAEFIGFVRRLYSIPLAEVFTHGELVETTCPGRKLQEYMTRARIAWAGQEHVAWQPLPRPPPATVAASRGRH